MSTIETRDLSRTYDSGDERVEAVRDVNLAVESGEYVAVLGESGSGKTTLLNLLGGLDRPTSGALRVLGHDLTTESESSMVRFRRENIGFVFQDFALMDEFSVLGNVTLPLHFDRALNHRSRAESLLDRFGLGALADRPAGSLSRGQMQRVALARALVLSPPILLGDEPTGSLDRRNADRILEHLRDLNREDGLTIVIATHSERLAREASRVMVLDAGRVTC